MRVITGSNLSASRRRRARPDASSLHDGFVDRLRGGRTVLLDGATGSELDRRGVDTGLPLWSAHALLEAPDTLRRVHQDYVEAGAEVITANTFRTHRRSLAAGGRGDQARELTLRAVDIARSATTGHPCWVAGSIAPLEDCYSPSRVPPDDELASEHAELVGYLVEAGVDLLLVETMNTTREALAAARAATGSGLPTIVGFVCDRDGRLLSGEDAGTAAMAAQALGPQGIAVNCTPAPDLHRALDGMREVVSLPLGAYGNVGFADDQRGWMSTDSVDPEAYARYAAGWLRRGVRLIGGCCGTRPEHIRCLRRLLDTEAW